MAKYPVSHRFCSILDLDFQLFMRYTRSLFEIKIKP
jgi:hypothetical protein